MNQTILQLVIKIIDSDLPRDTKEEIVRFYTLPRIVTQKPTLELSDDESEAGMIERPDAKDQWRKNNPQLAEGAEEMRKTLSK